MNQIERIKYYEKILNDGETLINKFYKVIDELKEFKPKKEELDKYYQSEERKKDVSDDQQNLLPKDLCRGVLGEDYAYDFLMAYEELEKNLKNI